MNAFKAIFLLSLLAVFLAPVKTQVQDLIKPEWSKFAKCSHLLIHSVSHLTSRIVPAVYDLSKCSGYKVTTPAPDGKRTVLWYAKVTYEFADKLVRDQPNCLFNLMEKLTVTLKPYIAEIQKVGCLDDDDYFL